MSQEDSLSKDEMPQQRRAFLITYSQADLSIFKDCESFSAAVVDAFGSANVVEWACCMESHADGGDHFHMSIKFKSSRLWGPVKKKFLRLYNVSLNFQTKSFGYVAAYRYVIKEKEISTVLHSEGHTPLQSIKSPKTKKAFRRFSEVSEQKKRRKLEEASGSKASAKPTRLTNVDVSNLIVREGIESEDKLLSLAWERAQDGEPDLQSFVLNKTPKARADLLTTTWRMQGATQMLKRSSKTRMEIISDTIKSECVDTCKDKNWLKCAKLILRNNKVNSYFFAGALRNTLTKGRQKNNNILIIGPKNCGKTFLLEPLELIFKSFVNPATTKYSWVNLEGKEVCFLNDFRWSPESIAWSDFLLLLEGQTVNLPRPKNQFATDLLIDRSNKLAIFATSKEAIKYAGKFGIPDERENDMMAVRWHMFTFYHEIKNIRIIDPCPRCFAELVLLGADAEEIQS